MANQETRRHHFVPETYLKKFSVQEKDQFSIHALPKSDPVKEKMLELNILNIGVQKDLYTLPGETAKERQLLESFYSEQFETHYDKIYGILTDPAKKSVNAQERELIIHTVVTMLYRTTKWISSHNSYMERVLSDMYQLTKHVGREYFMYEQSKISIAGKTEKQLIDEYKVENRPSQVMKQLEVALKLAQIRSFGDGIFVIKLEDKESEFLSSDNPVSYFRVGVNEITPFDHRNVLSLPLDGKHRLTLMPYADEETKHLIMRTSYDGRFAYSEKLTANYSQWNNAERFLLGSKSALLSYLSTKEETERPLTGEELRRLESRRKAFEEVLRKAKDLRLI